MNGASSRLSRRGHVKPPGRRNGGILAVHPSAESSAPSPDGAGRPMPPSEEREPPEPPRPGPPDDETSRPPPFERHDAERPPPGRRGARRSLASARRRGDRIPPRPRARPVGDPGHRGTSPCAREVRRPPREVEPGLQPHRGPRSVRDDRAARSRFPHRPRLPVRRAAARRRRRGGAARARPRHRAPGRAMHVARPRAQEDPVLRPCRDGSRARQRGNRLGASRRAPAAASLLDGDQPRRPLRRGSRGRRTADPRCAGTHHRDEGPGPRGGARLPRPRRARRARRPPRSTRSRGRAPRHHARHRRRRRSRRWRNGTAGCRIRPTCDAGPREPQGGNR